MEDKLLTKEDLAERWQVSITTINRWMADKIVSPIKGIPSVRFSLQHILELEGVKLDRLSPLERRRLEKEKVELERQLTALENENLELKEYVKNIVGNGVKFINVS